MKQEMISKILKVFTILAGIFGGLFFFWCFPYVIDVVITEYPEVSFLRMPALIGFSIIGIICYIALFFFLQICKRIGNQNSFCKDNALFMKYIGELAVLVCLLIICGDVYLGVVGFLHPSLVLVSLLFIFIGSGVSVICFSLASLILNAVKIKEENDLTI